MMEIVIPYAFFNLIPLFFCWFVLWGTFSFVGCGRPGVFDYIFAFVVSGFATFALFAFISLFAPSPLGIQIVNFSLGGAP